VCDQPNDALADDDGPNATVALGNENGTAGGEQSPGDWVGLPREDGVEDGGEVLSKRVVD